MDLPKGFSGVLPVRAEARRMLEIATGAAGG